MICKKTRNALDDGEVGCLNHPQRGNEAVFRSAKYYVDEMWPLVTRMYVWGLVGLFLGLIGSAYYVRLNKKKKP
jgi:hypothetical protein